MKRPQTAPSTSVAHAPSLEDRIHEVYRHLALIHAAARATVQDLNALSGTDTLDAIAQLALTSADLLEPLRHAPGAVANWSPDQEGTTLSQPLRRSAS